MVLLNNNMFGLKYPPSSGLVKCPPIGLSLIRFPVSKLNV